MQFQEGLGKALDQSVEYVKGPLMGADKREQRMGQKRQLDITRYDWFGSPCSIDRKE